MTDTSDPALSNRLVDLAERVKAEAEASAAAEATAIERALSSGRLLAEARLGCAHGEWLLFLDRAGMGERQAQRLMKLARSGLKADTVSDLGGIKATLKWLGGVVLPKEGTALLVSLGGLDVQSTKPIAFVWRQQDGYRVVMIDLSPEAANVVYTAQPIIDTDLGERVVWLTVWEALGYRFCEMSFASVPADGVAAPWLEMIRDMRAAA